MNTIYIYIYIYIFIYIYVYSLYHISIKTVFKQYRNRFYGSKANLLEKNKLLKINNIKF